MSCYFYKLFASISVLSLQTWGRKTVKTGTIRLTLLYHRCFIHMILKYRYRTFEILSCLHVLSHNLSDICRELNTKKKKQFVMVLKLHTVCVQSVTQLCPTLCDPTEWRPPSSTDQGIFQARILEYIAAISYSRRPPRPRDQTYVSCVSCIGRQILCH